MKKHLIAAAVAGAFAVPAMAQVTVSGSLDYAGIQNGKVTTQETGSNVSASTKTSATGFLNSWTTNQIVISGSEDLGGGLKAGFTVNSGVSDNGVGSRDTNVSLSGGFGTVRVGRFIPAAANSYHGFSGAASTAVGSIYHINNPSAGSARFAPTASFTAGNMERNNNQIQYTSNSIGGLTVNVNYGTNSSDASGTAGKAAATQQGIAVSYAAGPLSIGAGMADRKVDGAGVGGAESTAKIDGNLTYFGGSYNLGVASVMVTNASRKDETTAAGGAKTTNVDISVTSLGVSVPMGAITLNASMYQGDNDLAGAASDTELSGHQLSARYALSKRTTVYALMGENKIKRDGSASTIATRKETVNTIGLLHTF